MASSKSNYFLAALGKNGENRDFWSAIINIEDTWTDREDRLYFCACDQSICFELCHIVPDESPHDPKDTYCTSVLFYLKSFGEINSYKQKLPLGIEQNLDTAKLSNLFGDNTAIHEIPSYTVPSVMDSKGNALKTTLYPHCKSWTFELTPQVSLIYEEHDGSPFSLEFSAHKLKYAIEGLDSDGKPPKTFANKLRKFFGQRENHNPRSAPESLLTPFKYSKYADLILKES